MSNKTIIWKIQLEDAALRTFQSKNLTDEDKIIIRLWAETIKLHGPSKLLERPDIWADHPLRGEWEGYRSSSFSYMK